MKYTKPTLEVVELEITDVIAASGEQGSITVDNTTITGPKDQFSVNFGDL